MADIKITQEMIDFYRSKPGNSVLLDSTIIDLIKKDSETGRLPKEFTTLASEAQKTGYNATSSNLFGYGFGADSNMGLSFERTTKISYEHSEQKVCSPVTIAMNIQKFSGKNGEKILKAMQLALVDAFIPNKYEKQMVDESIKIARNAMKM